MLSLAQPNESLPEVGSDACNEVVRAMKSKVAKREQKERDAWGTLSNIGGRDEAAGRWQERHCNCKS